MGRIVILFIGYAIGCIQSAFIVGKLHGIDIREHGSGNAGTTNVLRTLGGKAGALVFLLDFLKGFLSVIILKVIFRNYINEGLLFGLYAGIGVVIGHNFPFYLNFKGGKGIACSMGLIWAIDFRLGLISTVIGITVAIFSKYISLGSITSTIIVPIIVVYYNGIGEIFYIMLFLSMLALFQHRSNIKRLAIGRENKFSINRYKDKLKN